MKTFLQTSVTRAIKIAAAVSIVCAGCTKAPVPPPPPQQQMGAEKPAETKQPPGSHKVKATYYGEGDGFAGKKTASGERFNPRELTAAHRTYPIGTRLRVTNLKNNKSVVVRVNDRGPFSKGKEIDLSVRAAEEIGLKKDGSGDVRIEKLEEPDSP